jgi:thiol-disulfide isomerase/thioredoxin
MNRFAARFVLLLILALPAAVWAEGEATLTEAQAKAMGLVHLKDAPDAPDFTLSGLDGKPLTLSSLKGKAVLLNFWATWCPPCREEMPSLEKLFHTFAGNPNFVILAVSSRETADTVKEFLAKTPYSFRVLLDTTGEAGSDYSVRAIPTTYLIDAQGQVVAGKVGAQDWTQPAIVAGLRQLLGR